MSRWNKKNIVENCLTLSISELKERNFLYGLNIGPLTWTSSRGNRLGNIGIMVLINEEKPESNCVQVVYSATDKLGKTEDMNYRIDIASTPCNFGGVRYWFICRSCGHRVGKLYITSRKKQFLCRSCSYLTYRSCQEHDKRVDLLAKQPERIDFMMREGIGLPLALKAAEKYLKES